MIWPRLMSYCRREVKLVIVARGGSPLPRPEIPKDPLPLSGRPTSFFSWLSGWVEVFMDTTNNIFFDPALFQYFIHHLCPTFHLASSRSAAGKHPWRGFGNEHGLPHIGAQAGGLAERRGHSTECILPLLLSSVGITAGSCIKAVEGVHRPR
jgi:hypothetical protein